MFNVSFLVLNRCGRGSGCIVGHNECGLRAAMMHIVVAVS